VAKGIGKARVSEELKRRLSKFPNVIAVSNTLKPRIKESTGEIIETELCIRVYVSEKLPLVQLKPNIVIPKEVEGIPVDVVTVGELRALEGKKGVVRPLKAGVSIGHEDITAGSFGWLYVKGGVEGLGSNAHVLTPDPSKPAGTFKGDDILSPGPYDDGHKKVGEYLWHEQINPSSPSGCAASNGIASLLNTVSGLLRRKTRFETVALEEVNHIDFAVSTKEVDVELECFDFDPVELGYPLIGHVFAGSSRTGVVCKLHPYILDEGWNPVGVGSHEEVQVGDMLRKSGRTSCDTRFSVIDESAYAKVSYGYFTAVFDDVIFTDNPDGVAIQGGDSGSSAWLTGEKKN